MGSPGWILAVVLIPLLGVLAYVIARGNKMSEHEGRWRAAAHDPERHKLEGARAGHPERVIPSHRMGRNSP